MSAVSLQEAGMVIAGRLGDDAAWEPLDALLDRLDIEIVAHDAVLAKRAREAFLRFGKGRHPASLNFGNRAADPCRQLGMEDDRRDTRPCPAATQSPRG